ncbi:carbonic anhydrase/acetyltransferase-like protein (isoleucine patch superfamily) [Paraburkholderia sp. BL27I4N3]|uniref:gamma carbonic anhydrase family protein n=1 Tax=Paraburkholderia sp. BL27I4N3 TaxID=1938805 RepID=UPI000E265135|nr:gamma carbonic anhydrase family protein [Paraburkholderia sp. BL27I4N3]REE19340.1 carbonic anhydrase/acetyltransferase-like protein (isoleucine patch superfamily) [Paraburkholderia sp. BL27I4N3]
MPILRLGELLPAIAESAFVAEDSTVIGQVTISPGASIWTNAVLRGDNEPIFVGENTNVQEGAVLHADPGFPLVVEDNVSIGHQAMLHGCTIGAGSLVGIQAVVLNGAVVGKNSLVGAGALITEGKVFPDNVLIVGAPAKVARELTADEIKNIGANATAYADKGKEYKQTLSRVG